MYAIPRRKMRGIPRRKSKRLSKLDKDLQALEHAGSPSTSDGGGPSGAHSADLSKTGEAEEVRGKGKGKLETPVVSFSHVEKTVLLLTCRSLQETKSYRTTRPVITPYTHPSPKSRFARPHLRPFLDPSSPLYESPYHRRQAQLHPSLLSGTRSNRLFCTLDSSSPLVERRRQFAPTHPQTPRLDIANPLYTLRPRGGVSSTRDDWMNRRKARWGKPTEESGL